MTYKYISQNGGPGPRFWELRLDYIESVIEAAETDTEEGGLDNDEAMRLLRLLRDAYTPRELFGVIQQIADMRIGYFVGRVDVVEYQFPNWVVNQNYSWDETPPPDGRVRRQMRHNQDTVKLCIGKDGKADVKKRRCLRTQNFVLETIAAVRYKWRTWRRPDLIAQANVNWHYEGRESVSARAAKAKQTLNT